MSSAHVTPVKAKSASIPSQVENPKGSARQSPSIFEAVKRGLLSEVDRILSSHSSSINDVDQFGQTPLHIAAFEGQVSISNLLISKGASISTQDKNGWTPLHSAASAGHLSICEKLLQLGAEPNAQVRGDFEFHTILHGFYFTCLDASASLFFTHSA